MDGAYIYRNYSSKKALSTVKDGTSGRFSASKYQFGRYIKGCGHRYDSCCRQRGRCRFFEIAKGTGWNIVGCEGCRKKTLAERKTRERAADREAKAFIEQQFVCAK